MLEGFGPFTNSEVKKRIREKAQDFTSTFFDGDASDIGLAFHQSLKILTCQYMMRDNTLSLNSAVNMAFQALVGENYVMPRVNGHYFRAPKQFDERKLGLGAKMVLADIGGRLNEFMTVEIPGMEKSIWQKLMENKFKDHGYFVTNNDESGVILMDGLAPLRKKDGSLVELKWEELEKRGGKELTDITDKAQKEAKELENSYLMTGSLGN